MRAAGQKQPLPRAAPRLSPSWLPCLSAVSLFSGWSLSVCLSLSLFFSVWLALLFSSLWEVRQGLPSWGPPSWSLSPRGRMAPLELGSHGPSQGHLASFLNWVAGVRAGSVVEGRGPPRTPRKGQLASALSPSAASGPAPAASDEEEKGLPQAAALRGCPVLGGALPPAPPPCSTSGA